MRVQPLKIGLSGLALAFFLSSLPTGRAETQAGAKKPPRPALVAPHLAPRTDALLKEVALRYEPDLTPQARDRDYLEKIQRARRMLGLAQLVDLRSQTLRLLEGRGEVSWEILRQLSWPQGDRVGVTLILPVWVPSRAQRVTVYAGFEKNWQTVALTLPRPSGNLWFAASLEDINRKDRYRPETLQVEVNSRFAPFVALFLEYIFREGWYEPGKRVPLLVVRCGEDTWAASGFTGPVEAECLSFPDAESASFEARVVRVRFTSLAELHHGRHVPLSNHRLGLALDLNDFNFREVVDGNPNPVSVALRQYNRDAMHRLDARHLPGWVYTAAKWLGLRIPQEWLYTGLSADWPHFDVGTRAKSKDAGH